MSDAAIVWFRQDMRLADNPALNTALARHERVFPVYLQANDGSSEWSHGAASRWWLHHSLKSLDASLRERGSRLIIRRDGTSADLLQQLVTETRAAHVYWNRLYEPHHIERDKVIKQNLLDQDIRVTTAEVIDFQPDVDHQVVAENKRGKKLFEGLYLEGRPPLNVGVTSSGDWYGGSQVALTDVLGDQNLTITAASIREYRTYSAAYFNLARRLHWGASVFEARSMIGEAILAVSPRSSSPMPATAAHRRSSPGRRMPTPARSTPLNSTNSCKINSASLSTSRSPARRAPLSTMRWSCSARAAGVASRSVNGASDRPRFVASCAHVSLMARFARTLFK